MTCGECHNSMAKAVAERIAAPDESKIVDIYGQSERGRHKDEKWYLLCTRLFPRTYQWIWNRLRKRNPMRRYKGSAKIGVQRGLKYVATQIAEYDPDAVVCTHITASNIVCWLKLHDLYHGKIYTILHDYVNCPYWEGSVLSDAVFTAHESVHQCLLDRGFRPEQLIPTGFPVRSEFLGSETKEEVRDRLGIPRDAFAVLLLNGGAGIGITPGIVKAIMKADMKGRELSLHVICGHNERAKKKLEHLCAARGWKGVHIYGFVRDVPSYYKAADLYFGRGGMGTVSEAMASGVNIVVREHPMAQERCNRDILASKGLCKKMKHMRDATSILQSSVADPTAELEMRTSVERFFRRDGAERILSYIHSQGQEQKQ